MGTSFVEYRGFGFWTRDSYLESWLRTLLEEMGKLPALEAWQKSLVEHWRVQAAIDGGCMSPGLDEFLTDGEKKDFVLTVAQGALERANPPGRRTGELFIDLLQGRLRTTDSSPIDYLHDSRSPSG